MTELYEFAKQFDVIVIFILLYGFAVRQYRILDHRLPALVLDKVQEAQ